MPLGSTQRFINLCSEANTIVDLAERKFSAWLSSVAWAYSDSWANHTKFLGKLGISRQAR
jgi:hypothetical protein